MVRKIHQKIKILYLNDKGKTDWLNVELDIKNNIFCSNERKFNVDDDNIKAVLFNDVSVFNQLFFEPKTSTKPKKTIKTKDVTEEIFDMVDNKIEG